MMRFKTITLGCKVNQCETSAIDHLLIEKGLQRSDENSGADLIVVNTCTVTGRAAMQSRQAVRQAIRRHPKAKIVVTGCYAQTAPDAIDAIEGVDIIVGHHAKMAIANLVTQAEDIIEGAPHRVWQPISHGAVFSPLPSVSNEKRTRAFLKIQDGCNTRCTYCIVPYARGKSRSMPPSDVIEHLSHLADEGLHEVVLTGIHLGAYGMDLQPRTTFYNLLSTISDSHLVDRIRISSIEPTEVDPRLIDLVKNAEGRICRHFHIPLQSGDSDTLRRMGRPYRSDQFEQVIQRITEAIADVAIGVDIMAGFPGETEKAFENSYNLISSLPISYLHVFPYSPRPGTPAASFKDRVPERIVKERCQILRQLGHRKQANFYRAMVGKAFDVLVETVSDNDGGIARGLTDNYLQVEIGTKELTENSLARVQINGIEGNNVAKATKL